MKPLPLPASDWPRFSALLDIWLDLEPGDRRAWLDALPENDARYRTSLVSADLRHESGYAVRLAGVTTVTTAPKGAKKN